MKLNPSCCPERISKGRYISMPLTYTMFSSKLPPRTLYCELSSLLLLTPACVAITASMLPPEASGARRFCLVSICWMVPVCRRRSVTLTSPSSKFIGGKVMFRLIFPCGRTNFRLRVWYPSMEKMTVTLSRLSNFSEYLPFRLLTVPIAVPSNRIVANSIGLPFSSVTVPPILTVFWARAGVENSIIRAVSNQKCLILFL